MKKLYLLLAVIVSGHSVSAQSSGANGRLSLGTSIGLSSGKGEEIVYRDTVSDNKLSQLLWHFGPQVYLGFDASYDWRIPASRWSIFADGILKFGFTDTTGQMEDRDWADVRYADFLTHYSVHDNTTKNTGSIDATIGASFTILEKHLLKLFIAYSYMNFYWSASGGSFLYPKYSDGSEGHGYIPAGEVGTYIQRWTMLSPGIAFYGELNRYFGLEAYIKMSPLIWLYAKDEHLLRGLTITQEIFGGLFIEPGFIFSFTPGDRIGLSLSFLYRNISGIRGDGDYRGNPTMITDNLNGAGYSAFDTGITVKFNFQNSWGGGG